MTNADHNENPVAGGAFFWLTISVVFVAFFLADHDLTVSTAEAFANTADEMQQQATGGNMVRRLVILAIAGLGVLGFMLPAKRQFDLSSPIGLLILAFIGWCFLSVLWSDVPSMTLRRVVVVGCLHAGACGIARQLSFRELLHVAWVIPVMGLVTGIGAELALGTFRPWAGDYRFSGTLHPNSQGLAMAAMCFATFCLARESGWQKRRYLILFGIGLVFLVLTKSRTSFAGVLLGTTCLLALRTASGVKWSVGLGAVWAVSLAAVCVLLLDIDVEQQLSQLALMGRKEQAASLTGRTPIWTALAGHVAQRPFVGFGYDSFWTPDRIDTVSSELQWGIREAHSAYIDTILSVGLIGALLLLPIVFTALRTSSKQYLHAGEPLFGFLFAMLVFGLLNGCTESGMTMPTLVPFLTVATLLQTTAMRPAFEPDTSDQTEHNLNPLCMVGLN